MSVRVLWPFAEALRTHDVDLASLVARAGLDGQALQDPEARIAHSIAVYLVDAAIEETGVSHLGLEAAEHFLAMSEDLLDYMSMTSPTTLVATESYARYARLVHDAADLRTEVTKDHVTSIYRLSGMPMHRAAIDFALGGMVVSFRRVSAEPPRIEAVEFGYPEPNDRRPYEEFFRAPLLFGRERNAVTFRREGYDRPSLRADPKLHEILRKQVERLFAEAPKIESFAERFAWRCGRGSPTRSFRRAASHVRWA